MIIYFSQKETGMLLAARFCLFTEDYSNALRIIERFLPRGKVPSSQPEMEAKAIEVWIHVLRAQSGGNTERRKLVELDAFMKGKSSEQLDLDILMGYTRALQLTKRRAEALNYLNQVIIFSIT
jgi:hypothetical protein